MPQRNVNACVRGAFSELSAIFLYRSHWRITDMNFESDKTSWSLLRDDKPWGHFYFPFSRRRIQRVERDGRRRYGLSLRS